MYARDAVDSQGSGKVSGSGDMSFSKDFTAFYIKAAVFFMRIAGWLQSGNIRKNKNKSDAFKAKALTGYFARKHLPAAERLPEKDVTVEAPETIWQFWDNPPGQATPEIVKASIESVNRFKGGFEHKILNNSTMGDYSDLPGYVLDKFNKKRMDYAHFSDLLRLNLLKNHGGVWMDATAYMTDFVPEYIVNEAFFVFLTGGLTNYPYSFVQSCFIRAKKGAFLCEAWHQMCVEYWKKETKKIDYFQIHLMFKALVLKNLDAKGLFAQMPRVSEDETHQLTGNKLFEKFDSKEWERIKKASFFQKTTYRTPGTAGCADTYFSRLSGGGL
jgi:hypothetical protein